MTKAKDKIMGSILRLVSLVLMVILFLPNRATAITNLPELIGNPITVFNALPKSSQDTIIWFLGLLALTLVICIIIGVSKNIMKTSVGSSTKDAKLSTGGVMDNISILIVIIVGSLVIGVGGALILGLSTTPSAP